MSSVPPLSVGSQSAPSGVSSGGPSEYSTLTSGSPDDLHTHMVTKNGVFKHLGRNVWGENVLF